MERYCLNCGAIESPTLGAICLGAEPPGPHAFDMQPVDTIVEAVIEQDGPDDLDIPSDLLASPAVDKVPDAAYWPPQDMLKTMGYEGPNAIDHYLRESLDNDGGKSIACCHKECVVDLGSLCPHGHPALTDYLLSVRFGQGSGMDAMIKHLHETNDWTIEDERAVEAMSSEGGMQYGEYA